MGIPKQNAGRGLTLSWFLARVTILLLMAWGQALGAAIPHGTVELVAEDQSIAPGRLCYLGLHFQLEQGWHIYWINPGDSGEPPRTVWHLPAGMAAGEMQWPAPKRIGSPTIADFGYEGETMLLVPIRTAASLKQGEAAQVDAYLNVLVCREICIPGKTRVSLSIPIRPEIPQPDSRTREIFSAARKSLPKKAPSQWRVDVLEHPDSLVLVGSVGREIRRAAFFPLLESQISNSAAQKMEPNATGFRLTLVKSDQLTKPISRLKGVLEFSANESYVIDAPVGGPFI